MDDVATLARTDAAAAPATLSGARMAAAVCTACSLYRNATQTVFGEGPRRAAIMMVGEQPGDREDLAGRPFVGPAGRLLDRALADAGIERSAAYLTNAVKHFKNEPRGKRRLHKRPDSGEIRACRPWLMLEIGLVRPRIVLALGATALQGLLARTVTVSSVRGTGAALADGTLLLATIHPSALLRMRADAGYEAAYAAFVADLRGAADAARKAAATDGGGREP